MPDSRIVVLASGTGSLLQAIIDSHLRESLVAVGSDVDDAQALGRAENAGVATFVVPMRANREEWDRELCGQIRQWHPDLIVTAGFMRILGQEVISEFTNRIVNSHPALLPAFPGAHAVRDAVAFGAKVTGCTVHLVDAGIDTGPIIAQQPVVIDAQDTEESLHERIKEIERVLLVDVLTRAVHEGISVRGRSVAFGE